MSLFVELFFFSFMHELLLFISVHVSFTFAPFLLFLACRLCVPTPTVIDTLCSSTVWTLLLSLRHHPDFLLLVSLHAHSIFCRIFYPLLFSLSQFSCFLLLPFPISFLLLLFLSSRLHGLSATAVVWLESKTCSPCLAGVLLFYGCWMPSVWEYMNSLLQWCQLNG